MNKTAIAFTFFSLLILIYTIYDYNEYASIRENIAIEKGTSTAISAKNHLDSISVITTKSAEKLGSFFTSESLDEEKIRELIKSETKELNFLAGITIAFEPYAFDPNQKLYGLYYQRKADEFFSIEDKYDYKDSSLATTQWYSGPAKSLQPALSAPYFGEVAQELVIDYSIPLFKLGSEGEKVLYAVLSYTIAPDKFTEVVNSFIKGNSGYVYLTNRSGDIITHPNRSYILNHKVLDYNSTNEHADLVDQILQNKSGHVNYISPYTSVESTLYFQTAELTEWKIAVIYSRTDLMGSPNILERKIIHIAISASILLAFLMAIVFRVHTGNTQRLWKYSIGVTLLFMLNISVIWLIKLDMDYSEELENTTRVYSNNALSSFVNKKNYEQKRLGKSNYLEIPTGVFIEELLVTDSYNMSASGKIWQKWPVDHDLQDKTGFHFLQASPVGRSVNIELLSKDRLDSATWLYTWKFNSTLRVFFDYAQYPLDQHYIDIKLIYPDMTDKIMLVPDFDSYEVLNPSAKPGLSDIIFLPRHRIIASYFSFSSLDMKTFFGQNRETSTPEYEALEYNIVIKRRFITPFISFVIPFILGASIIFFLLYSLSKSKDDNSGVTVMGVVQGMAALFFSMLLAHITIRNKIPTPHITYLETFYFVIYLLIILLILIVVMYSRSTNYKWLNYRNNLITKVLYWPFLSGILYLITLIKFY